jgi:hypothetical protein
LKITIIDIPKEDQKLLEGEYEYLKALIAINKLQIMVNQDHFQERAGTSLFVNTRTSPINKLSVGCETKVFINDEPNI